MGTLLLILKMLAVTLGLALAGGVLLIHVAKRDDDARRVEEAAARERADANLEADRRFFFPEEEPADG